VEGPEAEPRSARRGDLAERCDREAIQRDPRLIEPHNREAQNGIAALSAGLCSDRDRCRGQILEHADAIAAADPDSIVPAVLRARLLVADGKPEDGARLLGKACERAVDRVSCLQELVTVAAKVKEPALLDAASRELLGTSCAAPATCAAVATFLAGVRGGRGETGVALSLLGRAAREDPNDDQRWLHLADVASQAGAHAQAMEALEKVARRHGGGDPALKQRIDAERGQVLGGYISQPR
jgi:predicted Zn-dependent protease